GQRAVTKHQTGLCGSGGANRPTPPRGQRRHRMQYNTPSVVEGSLSPTPDVAPLPCYRCGTIDAPRLAPGTGPHALRANCPHWGPFRRWTRPSPSQEPPRRREAARREVIAQKPPSQLQLAYLQALRHSGPPPAHMAEASMLIDALLSARRGGRS